MKTYPEVDLLPFKSSAKSTSVKPCKEKTIHVLYINLKSRVELIYFKIFFAASKCDFCGAYINRLTIPIEKTIYALVIVKYNKLSTRA